jgi:hypothetical protein
MKEDKVDKQVLSPLKPLTSNILLLNSLFNYLDESIKVYQMILEKSSDPIDVYRAQGSIASLRKMKYIREEVNGENK